MSNQFWPPYRLKKKRVFTCFFPSNEIFQWCFDYLLLWRKKDQFEESLTFPPFSALPFPSNISHCAPLTGKERYLCMFTCIFVSVCVCYILEWDLQWIPLTGSQASGSSSLFCIFLTFLIKQRRCTVGYRFCYYLCVYSSRRDKGREGKESEGQSWHCPRGASSYYFHNVLPNSKHLLHHSSALLGCI